MHIAVFLQYYHTPDCPTAARPYALVERLARDHEVTVITTRAWDGRRLAARHPWVPPGARLVRLDVPYNNAMGAFDRLQAFVDYAVRAVAHGLQMSRPDLLLGSSTPLTAAMAAATVAWARDVPWIFEVRDLWPAFPIQMGALDWPGLRPALRGLEAALYRSAAHVVTVSPDMEQHVRTVAPSAPVHTLPYGTDLDAVDDISAPQTAALRDRLALDRRFFVLYAGTFGRANAIPTLLAAADRLAGRSDVLFGFAGRGYHGSTVRRAARRHDHIRLIDPLPYPDALALFSIADLSLVSFADRPVLAANAPGKFFDSLSTGTPVVVTNPGWTKRFVHRHQCGWFVPPESPGALASRLRALLAAPSALDAAAQNARRTARRQFDRAGIMHRYARLVKWVGRETSASARPVAP
ncbi:MAG: glycosyltransferase family 4 protein [Salinibacter sp.]